MAAQDKIEQYNLQFRVLDLMVGDPLRLILRPYSPVSFKIEGSMIVSASLGCSGKLGCNIFLDT